MAAKIAIIYCPDNIIWYY